MEMQSFWQKPHVQFLLTLILVGVLAGTAAYTYHTLKLAQGAYTGEATVNVTGEGEVTAIPDIGTFTFGVRAEGEDAATAQANATEAMGNIVAYLEEQDVAEADIETANYNLQPKYRYEERLCAGNGYCPPGERVIDGYEVYQNVTVKVRDLDQAGALISGVGERGATNISQLSFTVDEDAELMAEARAAAIADAQAKAEVLAKNLGMKLGPVVGFNEQGNNPVPYGFGGAMEERAMAMDAAAPAVVPTGENEFTSTVTITYRLK